jgi:hypothetical protein
MINASVFHLFDNMQGIAGPHWTKRENSLELIELASSLSNRLGFVIIYLNQSSERNMIV